MCSQSLPEGTEKAERRRRKKKEEEKKKD